MTPSVVQCTCSTVSSFLFIESIQGVCNEGRFDFLLVCAAHIYLPIDVACVGIVVHEKIEWKI